MQIIKADSVSVHLGAVDPSLAFSKTFLEHRELVAQTAVSGIQGLNQFLTENSSYTAAIGYLQEATESIDQANAKAAEKPFEAASSLEQTQHTNATANGLKTQAQPYRNTAGGVVQTAQNAVNSTDASKPERTHANNVKSAADLLKQGMDLLANNADLNGALGKINQARTDATNARLAAETLRAQLQGTNPVPTARIQSLNSVINAAWDVINTANSSQTLTNSPIAQIRNHTPTTHDLGDGYTLSTWGNSGYMTLVDASGQGIIISPNGTVDPLNGAGEGWKFSSTSTFVLPNETKITITPGSSASILVTRGIHGLTLDGIGPNSWPTASPYGFLNGRTADRTTNDGHIVNLDGNASNWRMNGQVLGDAASREQVATSGIQNELRLDPTDVAVSPQMLTFIGQIGITAVDYDGDGKLNNEELAQVAQQIFKYVEDIQAAFAAALANVSTANQALFELNQLLDMLRQENEARQLGKQAEGTDNRGALQQIERRLLAALQLLRGGGEAAPQPTGNIQASAEQVLARITNFNQAGASTPLQSVAPQSSPPPPPGQDANTVPSDPSGASSGPDTIGDSLRRASRLLSGFIGGANLNILELPQTPAASGAQGAGAVAQPSLEALAQALLDGTGQTAIPPALQQLAGALAQLAQQLGEQLGLPPGLVAQVFGAPGAEAGGALAGGIEGGANLVLEDAALPALTEDLAAGLQGLLGLLDDLGIIPGEFAVGPDVGLQGLFGELQALLGGAGQPASGSLRPLLEPQAGPEAARSLLSFLGTLAQFGSALEAVAPQAGRTTPGQVEQAGAGSLTVLSRTAEQVALLLAGIAALGSAGAQQSSGNQGAFAPTSAELRLGLESFLRALSAFGVFGVNQQQDAAGVPGSPNAGFSFTTNVAGQGSISEITSNFFTDPELLKQLRANLGRAIQEQQMQIGRASTLFVQSQEVVQKFVSLIKEDNLVAEIVKSDDLSDEQQVMFDERMSKLRQDWGVEWGSENEERTPAGQSNLVTRAVQSGMLV